MAQNSGSKWNSINSLLAPSYFVSYSSKQRAFAEALSKRLETHTRRIWFDREALRLGDNWRDEIKRGIAASDELVLLISDDSMQSRVVMEVEIATAHQLKKAIRPFIILPLTKGERLPTCVTDIQTRDVSKLDENSAIAVICQHLQTTDPSADLKLRVCRDIHPRFEPEFLQTRAPSAAIAANAFLDTLRNHYERSSLVWLNSGLNGCLVGDWSRGLKYLREHANAANSFPGWYFLALHGLQQRLVLNLSVAEVREARDAINNALAIEPHPFAYLVAAIIECGGFNLGPRQAQQRIQSFLDASARNRECPSEVRRLFWCIQPSLRVLGQHGPSIAGYLKELSRE